MNSTIRPAVTLLSVPLAEAIIDEAYDVLDRVGVYVESDEAGAVFREGGCVQRQNKRFSIPRTGAERCLALAPRSVTIWDVPGTTPRLLGGDEVHFDPGSSALRIYDHQTREEREAAGILDELVRLSVGCEDFEDLQADLDKALSHIPD